MTLLPLKMKRPSPVKNSNASAQSLKISSLALCLCVGMSQWNLATSLLIPQRHQPITQPSSIASYSITSFSTTATTCTGTSATTTTAATTSLSMNSRGGGNFQDRMKRYRGDMEQDDEQPVLEWDWDDDDNDDDINNDDMFGQQQQQPEASSNNNNNNKDGDTGELPTGDIAGATLSEDMKEKAKNAHLDAREESSQGGSKFRELMARASKQTTGSAATVPPSQPVTAAQVPPPPPAADNGGASPPVSIPPNPMDLSIEEQAALFRQMMAQKQNQEQQQNPYSQEMAQFQKQQQQQERKMRDPYQTEPPRVYGPPPDLRHPYAQQQQEQPPPRKDYRVYGTGSDGRKIGRNNDAEAIANAADVYLAKLKRDSTSRNYARYAGDDQVANEVFHDPSIQQIYVPENPYREAQREREKDLIETVPEEMLIFQDYDEVEAKQAAPRMSYKEKLAQFKNKQKGDQQQQQQ